MKKDSILQYLYAFIVAALMVVGLYGAEVGISGESGMSAFNVSLAASSMFLLGMVLLLGPLSRLFTIFDRFLIYRKELGIMSFLVACTHVYLVMFPLARNGPWGLFVSRPFSAYPGLESLIVLFILFLFSWNWSMKLLGTKLWWQIQYWGARAAFALLVLHMAVLKYDTILDWILPGRMPETSGLHAPPLIIWEAQFVLLVLLVRFSELFGQKTARIITQISTAFVIVTLLLVTFGR